MPFVPQGPPPGMVNSPPQGPQLLTASTAAPSTASPAGTGPSSFAGGSSHADASAPQSRGRATLQERSAPMAVPSASRFPGPLRHQRNFQSQLRRQQADQPGGYPMSLPQMTLFDREGMPPCLLSPMDTGDPRQGMEFGPRSMSTFESDVPGSIYDHDLVPGPPPDVLRQKRKDMLDLHAEEFRSLNDADEFYGR